MEAGEAARPRDEEIYAHHQAVCEEEVSKFEFVGDKEPLSVLACEYEVGNPVFKAKIENLGKTYGAIRRTRGDGNCFFRSFMFSYLEYILQTENHEEAARVLKSVEECRKSLINLGYAEFTFEDFLTIFVEQLESVLPGKPTSISIETLLERSRDQGISNYVVMFFRFVTASEIKRRADFFEPFILGMSNTSVDQFCKASVEPMGEESDHVHITALTDALGVPVRVVYLDRSIVDNDQRQQDPHVILLYRPGHYDILYAKASSASS